MEALDTLNRWLDGRLRDHARRRSFLRFLWRRFLDDNLFQAAGALSFTTVFALVPLSMVVFSVLSAFPVYDKLSNDFSSFIFANFVPSAAIAVKNYLGSVVANTGKLTAVGVIALVVSLMITIYGIEGSFNRIWRVKTGRPKLTRFLVYWTVLTLGALVAATTLTLYTRFLQLSLFKTATGQWLEAVMLRATPVGVEVVAIMLIFRVVPNRTVKWRHALAGALMASILFELVKGGLGIYVSNFKTYQNLYGTLAFVPIFLLWIYLAWVSILLGASFAASVSAFRYQPAAMRLPEGYELYGLLRLLGRFGERRREGRGLHSDEIQALEPMLTDDLIQELVGDLDGIGLLSRAESGEWLLSRDLGDITMAELYEACGLRIPIAEAHLPCRDDALGLAAADELDQLRVPLRELLKRRVSSVYESLIQEPA